MSTNFNLHTSINDPLTIQQFQALLENLIPGEAITGTSLTVVNGQLELADDSVGTAELQDDSVGPAQLQNDSVGSTQLQDNGVGADQLAQDAVTTAKVADGAITRDKLAEDAMGIKSVQRFSGSVNGPASSFTEVIDLNVDGNPVDFSKTSVSGNFSNYTNRARFITLSVNESTQEITITFFGPDSTGYYIEVLEFY